YIFGRIAAVVAFPLLAYVLNVTLLSHASSIAKFAMVAIMTVLAIFGPDAYISRRQRTLIDQYGTAFPDLLDLLVVCVDADLSLEAALDRISREMVNKNRALGMNLLLMGTETRAGSSTIDALSSFADR